MTQTYAINGSGQIVGSGLLNGLEHAFRLDYVAGPADLASVVTEAAAVPEPATYVPGVTMPSEVILTIGWNVLSHVELEPAHCGDESCEADHGYLGTITADDLTLRISEAADGEDAVRQVLQFASALNDAVAHAGS